MKTQTRIDLDLLQYCIDNKMLKQFAFYVKIKSMHRNPIIYDYLPKKLAKGTGLNHKTVERYVSKLKQHNFIDTRDGNLLARNYIKIKQDLHIPNKLPCIFIDTRYWTSYRGIYDRICYAVLKNNSKQQEFNAIVNFGHINRDLLGKKDHKKAIKKAANNGTDHVTLSGRSELVLFSSRQIGKLLGISNRTASRLIIHLRHKGYLLSKQVIERFDGIAFNNFNLNILNEMNGYFYVKNNIIHRHRGLKLSFII